MYDALLTRWPSTVVELNRLAAASFVPGVDLVEVLAGLDRLATDPSLATYTYLPSTRADVLARLGRVSEAASAYDEAAALCANETERRFLVRRRASVVASRSDS